MAKRTEFSCILSLPCSQHWSKGLPQASEPLSRVSSTRRRVPCSAEMDKIGRYACQHSRIYTQVSLQGKHGLLEEQRLLLPTPRRGTQGY